MAAGSHAPCVPPRGTADRTPAPPLIPGDALHHERPSRAHALRVLGVGLLAWALPVGAAVALTGAHSIFTVQSLFFSGAAVVTFGGAYAVLAYVAQRAVEVYGWLAPGEMVRGLVMAETPPGPLIMVVQVPRRLERCGFRHARRARHGVDCAAQPVPGGDEPVPQSCARSRSQNWPERRSADLD